VASHNKEECKYNKGSETEKSSIDVPGIHVSGVLNGVKEIPFHMIKPVKVCQVVTKEDVVIGPHEEKVVMVKLTEKLDSRVIVREDRHLSENLMLRVAMTQIKGDLENARLRILNPIGSSCELVKGTQVGTATEIRGQEDTDIRDPSTRRVEALRRENVDSFWPELWYHNHEDREASRNIEGGEKKQHNNTRVDKGDTDNGIRQMRKLALKKGVVHTLNRPLVKGARTVVANCNNERNRVYSWVLYYITSCLIWFKSFLCKDESSDEKDMTLGEKKLVDLPNHITATSDTKTSDDSDEDLDVDLLSHAVSEKTNNKSINCNSKQKSATDKCKLGVPKAYRDKVLADLQRSILSGESGRIPAEAET